MKIVLDSNILLVAVAIKSSYRPIWTAFLDEKFDLILSDDILYEYGEIMQRHSKLGLSNLVMEVFADSANVIRPQVYYSWNAITADPDDNKFFDIAVAANADYLVTNDTHFDIIKDLPFPKVNILSANEFLDLLLRQ